MFSQKHMSSLGNNLNNQRKTGSRCDTTLICGDQKFRAHQNILCAASEYFSCLLDGGFSESRQEEIDLTESIGDPEILECLLEFIYTGTMNITAETFRELLDSASMLLLPGGQELVSEYLTNTLVIGNCLEIYTLAYKYSLQPLSELCLTIIKARMHDYFIHGSKLLEIPPEVLTHLLKENVFVRSNKPDVSKAIDEYINNLDAGNEDRTKALEVIDNARSCGIELKAKKQFKEIQNKKFDSEMLSTKKKGKAKTSRRKEFVENDNEEMVIVNYKENAEDSNDYKHKSTFYGWLSKSNKWIKLNSIDQIVPRRLSFIGIADSSMVFMVINHHYVRDQVISVPLSQGVMTYMQEIDLPYDYADNRKYFAAWNQLFCIVPVSEKVEVKCSKKKTVWSTREGDKTIHIDVIVSYSIHRYSAQNDPWTKACDIDVPENYYKDIGALKWCAGGVNTFHILPCMDMKVTNTGGTVHLTMVNSGFPRTSMTSLEGDFITVFTLSQRNFKELKCELKFQLAKEHSLCVFEEKFWFDSAPLVFEPTCAITLWARCIAFCLSIYDWRIIHTSGTV